MAPHKTVTVNGRRYDAVTGLPIDEVQVTNADKTPIKAPKPAPAPKAAPKTERGTTKSEVVHSTAQRSQTLHRRATKKPAVPNKPITKRSAPGRHMDIAKSANVSRFAQHPETKPVVAAQVQPAKTSAKPAPKATPKPAPKPVAKPAPKPAPKPDKPAQPHPVAQRALVRTQAKKAAVVASTKPITAKDVKDAEISKALAAPKPKAPKEKKRNNKTLRRTLIISGVVLAFIIILLAVWKFVPTLSVSVAAAQAGIEATYPEYTPDGYSLSQPVIFSDGQVTLKFASNSNDNYYTVDQVRSSWDSSAVLDNVVTPAAGADYTTTKERGLTIYTYDSNAAWVNGGILYQIDSKAPLSGDQIRKIATSL